MAIKTAVTNSMEERVIRLLAAGLPAIRVAESLGIEASKISQMMSEEQFKARLAEEKFTLLNRHNEADKKLDELEDVVRDQLAMTVPMIFDPMKLARVFQVVNAAKRRGAQLTSDIPAGATVVNLNMPQRIVNNFVVNSHNQVIQAGGEDLVTIQPSRMQEMLQERDDDKNRIADKASSAG